jgi:hypothetical protein
MWSANPFWHSNPESANPNIVPVKAKRPRFREAFSETEVLDNVYVVRLLALVAIFDVERNALVFL